MSKGTLYFRDGAPYGTVDILGASVTGFMHETTNVETFLSMNGDVMPYAEQVGQIIKYWTGVLDAEGYGVWGLVDVLPHPDDGGGEGGL